MTPGSLILASASHRRYQLLSQIGCTPDLVIPADVDETKLIGERPEQLVTRLASLKGEKVFRQHDEAVIVAADTTVAVGRRVIGKPGNISEAEAALMMLSGRNHRVYTSVYMRCGGSNRQRCVETRVKFKKLTRGEISAYLASNEWAGKAGGYAVQGKAAAFIVSMVGSYTNVVGLPLYETYVLLSSVGYPRSQ
tara:strand:+ start:868 stop:1449 length:582 start_codon:yes stop_codon:yes gene_type:complete